MSKKLTLAAKVFLHPSPINHQTNPQMFVMILVEQLNRYKRKILTQSFAFQPKPNYIKHKNNKIQNTYLLCTYY